LPILPEKLGLPINIFVSVQASDIKLSNVLSFKTAAENFRSFSGMALKGIAKTGEIDLHLLLAVGLF